MKSLLPPDKGGHPREDARNAALAAIVDVAGIKPARLLVRLGLSASRDSSNWGWFPRARRNGRAVLSRNPQTQPTITRRADDVVSLVENVAGQIVVTKSAEDPRRRLIRKAAVLSPAEQAELRYKLRCVLVDELSPLLKGLPGVGLSVEQIQEGLREELHAASDPT